ncbi:60Kd inner membrane protein-domain-containing protein [Mycena crocata]|nr:60Kd inner membrane protein-domain-containing protein [Mycena crocata]
MLAVRSGLSLRRVPRCVCPRQPSNKRFFIQSLSDGFLDLAIALPYPPSIPPYSATIILVAVTSRLLLFPLALWGRNRVRRLEDVVVPELERLKPIISKQVLDDMKREGLPRELLVPAKLQQIHLARMKAQVQAESKRLIAKHKCHPFLSMAVSPATQLPVFVVMTAMFSRLAQAPTPFDSEAFFTLTSLNHSDPTWTLPIILGLVTMANVESNNWLLTAVQRDRMRKAEEKRAKLGGIQPSKIMKNVLNGLSVVRIIWAAVSPGSVVLYWTTSATFGLLQTWVLDYRPTAVKAAVDVPAVPVPAASPGSLAPKSAAVTPKALETVVTKKKKSKSKHHKKA